MAQAAVAREVGVPRSTVREWLRIGDTVLGRRAKIAQASTCDGACVDVEVMDGAAYAYLLGQYLGDGCISAVKLSFRLRISCCDDYPGIMDECARAISAVHTDGHVRCFQRIGCTELTDSWHHWPCLLPHGDGGVKHKRRVELAEWQRRLALDDHPGQFVRGLIHSDGWRGTNRVRGANGATYEYPRYIFSNRSAEIRQLFVSGCDRLGVESRRMNAWTISVARRSSVAELDRIIGPKY